MRYDEQFSLAKEASLSVALLTDEKRQEVLCALADSILLEKAPLLEQNALDCALLRDDDPLKDRLRLTPERLDNIALDMLHVAKLASPLGIVWDERTLPNGLRICRRSVPFGVIGIVYEARPNVTFDVFSLCFKSGNACLLKGSRSAERSNQAIVRLIKKTLQRCGVTENAVTLLPSSHEAAEAMLSAVGYVDLCIPRGGKRLIEFVRDTARVPVIETGAGVVSTYFDKDGDLSIGRRIVNNAKTRRVSVCNALDCLLVHRDRLIDLPLLLAPLAEKGVVIYADGPAYKALQRNYPKTLLCEATEDTFGTEFLDYKMAVATVSSLEQAVEHIAKYDSGHSESIVTRSEKAANLFQDLVDAACVYVNAPTSFTDGAQFGLGAEIGISTQKLGPRGPMGLREMTTYKWLIHGEGQIRP